MRLQSADRTGSERTPPRIARLECNDDLLTELDISGCEVLNRLVKETSPGEYPGGRYGWWEEDKHGRLQYGLAVDPDVHIITK